MALAHNYQKRPCRCRSPRRRRLESQSQWRYGGSFAHLLTFCYLLLRLISPLPFQLFKQGKKKTPSRSPASCARCNKVFGRPYDARKHFNSNICKPATTARKGTLEYLLIKPKTMAPAPTSSFSSSPSLSGSSFKNTPDFSSWFQNASALSLNLAQVCLLDLIPYLSAN